MPEGSLQYYRYQKSEGSLRCLNYQRSGGNFRVKQTRRKSENDDGRARATDGLFQPLKEYTQSQ
jgi:hypothetical protein